MSRASKQPIQKRKRKDGNVFFSDGGEGLLRVDGSWKHVTGLDEIDCTGLVRYTWPLLKKMEKELSRPATPASEVVPDRIKGPLTTDTFVIEFVLQEKNQRAEEHILYYAQGMPAATMEMAKQFHDYTEAMDTAEALYDVYNVYYNSEVHDPQGFIVTGLKVIRILKGELQND